MIRNPLSNILGKSFSDSSLFCGTENVIHCIFYYNLVEFGVLPTQIARQFSIKYKNKNKYFDLAVFDTMIDGHFSGTKTKPKLIIEFKGGAKGRTNALKKAFNKKGLCSEIEKLEDTAKEGIQSWFICVDMPQLGGSVNYDLISRVQSQCRKRNICFAYYCQGEQFFIFSQNNSEIKKEKIGKNKNIIKGSNVELSSLLNQSNKIFNECCQYFRQINGHEANYVGLLYHLFRKSGLVVPQVSLETHFLFAQTEKALGRKGQVRPDIVIFKKGFDGAFNLFKNGNKSKPNDDHKLSHIKALIEVKGSASLRKKRDDSIVGIFEKDIEKLQNWQDQFNKKTDVKPEIYFVAVDIRDEGLSSLSLKKIFDQAGDIKIIYITNQKVICHY